MTSPMLGGRRWVPFVGIGIAVLLIAAVVGYLVIPGSPTRTVKAQFAASPGLFKGNHVDVLGVPVGTVTNVKATDGHAEVTMKVKKSVKLPATVGAVIMAPQVVADRFVQLIPAYAGGATMPEGATIPVDRTAAPQSIDTVVNTLNDLASQLGPNGANANGALTQLLSKIADQLRGNGSGIHSAVTNFSTALGAISDNSGQLKDLLTSLGTLSQKLAQNNDTYKAFTGNLASVSTYLANDGPNIQGALTNLQAFFSTLTSFIQQSGGSLQVDINGLDSFVQGLSQDQDALEKVFDLSPLTLQNLNNAINLNAPGGPAIRTRYDPLRNSPTLFNQVCGNSTIRFLVVLANGTETNPLTPAGTTDTVCAIGNALNALTPPPNAAAGPNLTLSALTAGASR